MYRVIVQRIHSLDSKGVDLFISRKIQLFKANTRLQKQKQKVYPSQPYLSSVDFCPPCLRLISTIQNMDVGGRVNKFAQTSVPWKFIRLRQKKTCFRQKILCSINIVWWPSLTCTIQPKNMKNFFVSFELATSAYSFLPSLAFLCGWTLLRREGINKLN